MGASLLAVAKSIYYGGGGPHVGEITRLGGRLFRVLYFSIRSSRSSALRYGLPPPRYI